MSETYAIDVVWHEGARLGLPTLIGPFASLDDAENFGRLNIPNGTWYTRVLSYPFARSLRVAT